MKFTVLTTLLAATAASSFREQDGALGIGFLTGYDLVFLKCQAGVSTTKEDGTIEKSAVIFRLCPVGEACATKQSMSCTSGYGDFMTGLTTFAHVFMDTYHRGYGEANHQHTGINWADYGECRQFDASEYDEGGIYAGGGAVDEDVQYFIGPACTNDGTSIRLALFTDEDCTVESDGLSFRDITGDDLLYESGGIAGVGQCQWYNCGYNESGEMELHDSCVKNLEYTIAKCETYMDGLLTYAKEQGISYTKDESGCPTIAQYYKSSKTGGKGASGGGGMVGKTSAKAQGISYSRDESGSSTIAQHYKASKNMSSSGCGMSQVCKTFLILGIAVVVIGIAFFVFAKQRRKEGAPVEYLKVSPAERLE
jgi:hypothetical protein